MIRQEIIDCLELASMPDQSVEEMKRLTNFVVVGGGPTGIELAAELHDFLVQDLRRWYPHIADYVKITVLEASDRILGSFATELGDYTSRLFRKRKINLLTDSLVSEVTEQGVILQNGERLQSKLKIWTAGIAPRTLLTSLNIQLDQDSRVKVDPYLAVRDFRNIYALGDCAQIEGADLPATTQVAQQQGKYLAQALNRKALGKKVKPFVYRNLGMLVYVGNSRALAEIGPIHWKGFGAWVFWRSVL